MKSVFSLQSFIRFLGRNKLYSAINILGFALSLMFVILLALYARRESETDDFQQNRKRIFLLSNEHDAQSCYPLGQRLKDRFPEIENFVLLKTFDERIAVQGSEINARIMLTDPSFLQIFSYRTLEGSREEALAAAGNAMVSETFARRHFGTESPIGKTLIYYGNPLSISAVFADFGNSTIETPEIIMRSEHAGESQTKTYNSAAWELYLLAGANSDLQGRIPDMLEFMKGFYWVYQDNPFRPAEKLLLIPLKEAYFTPLTGSVTRNLGNRNQLILFSSIGALILIFAVINYINLSVAQAGKRAREMATRRLVGGSRKQLVASLIFESVLLCAFSLLIGLLLAALSEPLFNRLVGTSVSVADSFSVSNILSAAGCILLLGTAAGAIPAAVISNHRPIEIVQGDFRRKNKMTYSRILIAFQFLITIVLIGCTFTMIRQIRLMTRMDMGFRTDMIYEMEEMWYLTPEQQRTFRNEALRIPGVDLVSLSEGGSPVMGGNNNTDSRSFPDKIIPYQSFIVDSAFFEIMELEILRDNRIRDSRAVWLNEKALEAQGLDLDAESFIYYGERVPIAGVVRDFHFRDATYPVGPARIVLREQPETAWSAIVRISGENPQRTVARLCELYRDISGTDHVSGEFLDRTIRNWYQKQERLSSLIGGLSVIAVVIATLGILAMATYFIGQRSLEIAVRKVFGSTKTEILNMLVANFLRPVALAFVAAVPLIVLLMRQWLADYTVKTPLHWTIFALTGASVLTVALLAILWQSLKAANANPVETIKK